MIARMEKAVTIIAFTDKLHNSGSGIARNLIWGGGIHFNYSHCNFKTCVNVPHVNKTVTDFGGIYTDIPPRPPSLHPWIQVAQINSGSYSSGIRLQIVRWRWFVPLLPTHLEDSINTVHLKTENLWSCPSFCLISIISSSCCVSLVRACTNISRICTGSCSETI